MPPKYTLFLTGLKDCGKTTLANHLADEGWLVVDGLAPAKARLRMHLEGLPRTEIDSIMDDTKFRERRLVLGGKSPQLWILECLRTINQRDFYSELMKLLLNQPSNRNVVVDSCYLKRTLNMIRNRLDLKGAIVRVERPGQARQSLDTDTTILSEPSPSDIVIVNCEGQQSQMIRELASRLPPGILTISPSG